MISKVKNLESDFCIKVFFPMVHSLKMLAPFYISDSISHPKELIILNSKQNESLMRIESLISKQIQAIFDNLKTWSLMFYGTILAYN